VRPEVAELYNVSFLLCGLFFCRRCSASPPEDTAADPVSDLHYYRVAELAYEHGWRHDPTGDCDALCPQCLAQQAVAADRPKTGSGSSAALDFMSSTMLRRLVTIPAWLFACASGGFFLRVWLAPDACLDFGGSFNYERWVCSGDTNPYRLVHFYELKSFWLFVGVSMGACLLQWRWSNAIQQTTASDHA
jgi:hypothetical protein